MQVNVDTFLRSSNDNQKRKSNNKKGLHDWKKNGENKGMQESQTPFNTSNRSAYPPFKKTSSLNEARNKLKAERVKNEKGRRNIDFNNTKEGIDNEHLKVP